MYKEKATEFTSRKCLELDIVEDCLELLALYVHGGLVSVHQVLQLLHVGALQHRHLDTGQPSGHGRIHDYHLDPLPQEDEGGHGGDLMLRRDVLAVIHVNLEEEEVNIVQPAGGGR